MSDCALAARQSPDERFGEVAAILVAAGSPFERTSRPAALRKNPTIAELQKSSRKPRCSPSRPPD